MAPTRSALSSRGAGVVVVVVVTGVLGLGGCAEDGEPRSDPTWTPTATPEAPSSSPAATPTRPVLPEAAKEATPAGAKAFIQHYWALINYAQATGDVKPVRALSPNTCTSCAGVADGIRKHYKTGGHLVGGENHARVATVQRIPSDSRTLYAFDARVVVKHDAQTIIESDGAGERRASGKNDFRMMVAWVGDGRWRLEHMEVE